MCFLGSLQNLVFLFGLLLIRHQQLCWFSHFFTSPRNHTLTILKSIFVGQESQFFAPVNTLRLVGQFEP